LKNGIKRYIVKAFYQKQYYVKSFKSFVYNKDIALEITDNIHLAQKLSLDNAAKATKILKEKGFIDIDIKEV
jgi:hypothetical protein